MNCECLVCAEEISFGTSFGIVGLDANKTFCYPCAKEYAQVIYGNKVFLDTEIDMSEFQDNVKEESNDKL